MWRRLIQAIGHFVTVPFGYDVCVSSGKNEQGVWTQRLVLAKIILIKKTRYVVRAGSLSRACKTFDRAVATGNWFFEDHNQVEIWQEDTTSRLLSKRTKG